MPATSPPTSPAPTAPGPTKPTPHRTGTWRTLPAAPVPAGAYVSVWTGREFIVHTIRSAEDGTQATIDAGYTPSTNRWRVIPPSPYPVPVTEGGFRAVWTGTEMLTFGQSYAAYNPRTNRWRPIPPGPAGPSVTVWTGRQVLMWGGGCCGENSAAGSAFDPATNTWRPLPPAPISGRHTSGVWTGKELLVMGGTNDHGALTDGAAYNPATRTWRKLAAMPAPRLRATLTWTGTEVLMVGGYGVDRSPFRLLADGLAYNPTTNRWRSLPSMKFPRVEHVAVWTGRQLLVWGGLTTPYDDRTEGYAKPPYGVAYTPATNSWSDLPRAPLRGRSSPVAAWTGSEMIIWGGYGEKGFTDGAAFRPAPLG